MSRFTEPTSDDFNSGAIPRWFVTRYKSTLNNVVCPSAHIGTANDRDVDPAITSISTTIEGASGICNLPTEKDWSSLVAEMAFRLEIENNTAGTLKVDIEFYRAVYGSSGSVEDWQLFEKLDSVGNGDEIQITTDGSRVFARIAAITNDDGAAQLYLSARMLTAISEGGGEGTDTDHGTQIRGQMIWDETAEKWVRAQASSSGFPIVEARQNDPTLLNVTEKNSTAILADTASIDTSSATTATQTTASAASLAILDNVVGTHDAVATDAKFAKVGGLAYTGVPTAVTAGDDVEAAYDTASSGKMHLTKSLHYDSDSMTTRETPASGGGNGSSNISNAASTALNGGTTLDCTWVDVQNNGTGWMRFSIQAAATATTGIVLQPGDIKRFEVDDVALVKGWAQNLNDPCGYVYGTRA